MASQAMGPLIWLWMGTTGAAATSLPHRAARGLIYRISLVLPLLVGL